MRFRHPQAYLALFAILAMLGIVNTAAGADRIVIDALGRSVKIDNPRRILTLGSDVSEIVVALGGENRIAGVDRGSTYPESLAKKPNVGYRRATSSEGIISLGPDLILASEDVGTPNIVETFDSFNVPVVFVKIDNSLEGLRSKIRFIANVLDVQKEGVDLEQRVVKEFEAAADLAKSIPEDQKKRVIFFHGLMRYTAAGSTTAADAIIRYAGGINPVTFEGYKSLSPEVIMGMRPDTILMLPDGAGGPTPERVFSNAVLASTNAGKNQSLMVLKGAYMINFGPRTADAIRSLALTLYPPQ